MGEFNIKHFDSCSANYSEKPAGEPARAVTAVDLGDGQVALHCNDCGAHVVMTVQSPDSNVEANRQELLSRSIVGLKKYGVTTERTDLNLSQWLQHLLEELLDAANYVQAAKNSVGDLQQAQDRLFDVLLGDDGQAHKEAERYLERANPGLYRRLILQRDGIDTNPSRDSLQP